MKHPELKVLHSRYGGPMGRRDTVLSNGVGKYHLYKMTMVGYGSYDSGGAYWGQGNPVFGYMYRAYRQLDEGLEQCFVRAVDRDEAKEEVRKVFKGATFYR